MHSIPAHKAAGILIAALVASAAIVGCGSSSGSPASSSSPSTSAKGTPYAVGLIATLSGPLSGDFGGQSVGIDAWEKWTNAHGGVDGHPVKAYVMDDQSSPSAALQDVKTLISQDHVLAILGVSDEGPAWAPYAAQHGVPIIGGNTSIAPIPDWYPTGDVNLTYGAVAAAHKAGAKGIADVYCSEAALCAASVPVIAHDAKTLGMTEPYATGVALDQPGYTATCLAARQHGADALLEEVDLTTITTLAGDCAQQNYKPLYIGLAVEAGRPYLQGMPSGTTMAVAENVFPWFAHSSPATERYWQALETYEPGVFKSNNFGPSLAMAWASGEMFAAAAAHLGAHPTPAAVKAGLYSLKNETLGGLIPPTTYTPGKASVGSGYFIAVLKNGNYTAPYGISSFSG
jgi:branched-chain amino acid transport system substrate-binding protein